MNEAMKALMMMYLQMQDISVEVHFTDGSKADLRDLTWDDDAFMSKDGKTGISFRYFSHLEVFAY